MWTGRNDFLRFQCRVTGLPRRGPKGPLDTRSRRSARTPVRNPSLPPAAPPGSHVPPAPRVPGSETGPPAPLGPFQPMLPERGGAACWVLPWLPIPGRRTLGAALSHQAVGRRLLSLEELSPCQARPPASRAGSRDPLPAGREQRRAQPRQHKCCKHRPRGPSSPHSHLNTVRHRPQKGADAGDQRALGSSSGHSSPSGVAGELRVRRAAAASLPSVRRSPEAPLALMLKSAPCVRPSL